MKKKMRKMDLGKQVIAILPEALAWAQGRDVPVTIREVSIPDPTRSLKVKTRKRK